MPIRMTGMISGMDTESLIKNMVDAQKLKNKRTTDKSTLLDWKQEKWKELNTKLYKLYQEDLSKLRLQGNYNAKKVSSSDSNIVDVTSSVGATNGSHEITITQLAKTQSIIGGDIKTDNYGKETTLSTKLNDLGINIGTNINITHKGKSIAPIEVKETTTINDFISSLKKAGLNASFDNVNKKIFISSKETGESNNFEVTLTTNKENLKSNILNRVGYETLSEDAKANIDEALTTLLDLNSVEDDVNAAINLLKTTAIKDAESSYRPIYVQEQIAKLKEEKAKAGASEDEINAINENTIGTPDFINTEVNKVLKDNGTIARIEKSISELSNLYKNHGNDANKDVSSQLVNLGLGDSGTKQDATNSIYTYNNVEFTSTRNDVSINGLALNFKSEGKTTISVSNDTKETYDMIKKFVTNYNTILKEMNELYYASSAKGYDPLSDEEKEAMTDKQIEKWEDKIKNSVLRRDDALGSVLNVMKTSIMSSVEVNGKKYSLSSFGIGTSSDYTEKGLLHINGDKEDALVSDLPDKLMKALEEDPDTVTAVLSGVVKNLYDTIGQKMKSIPNVRSAFTFYNDKIMANQQTEYKKRIKTLESKLVEVENKYYKQFAAMESALSKLQSQTNALAGMLGNGNQ